MCCLAYVSYVFLFLTKKTRRRLPYGKLGYVDFLHTKEIVVDVHYYYY